MDNFQDVSLEGVHKAKIIDNDDEFGRERLFVRVLGVHDISDYNEIKNEFKNKDYGIWIEHCAPSANESGDIPNIGEEVYMLFDGNGSFGYNTDCGVWIGVVRKNNFKR